jgi:hypothetical protein
MILNFVIFVAKNKVEQKNIHPSLLLPFFIRDPGWKKIRSGIRDKHPGSAALHVCNRREAHFAVIFSFFLLVWTSASSNLL